MDDSSAHLLERLADATEDRAWAMLVARQTGAAGFVPTAATEIALQPLTTDAVMQIIRTATAAAPLHPHDVSEIVGRVGGSPLFLGELLRTVGGTGTTAELPETLESLVGTQIDALPPLARRLLRYAAVLGRSFSTEIVDRVLEDEGIALDAASRTALADFIEPAGEDRLQFRHAMVRDVAYEGLSYGLRRTLHLRAGEAVEAVAGGKPDDVADLLSLHYSLGQRTPARVALRTGRRRSGTAELRERRGRDALRHARSRPVDACPMSTDRRTCRSAHAARRRTRARRDVHPVARRLQAREPTRAG